MIHPHFSHPLPLSQRYQQLRPHLLLFTMSNQFSQPLYPQPQSPHPPGGAPNLWTTNKQNQVIFFNHWTPEMNPCNDPLCRTPHHQSQTTSHSPCLQTILPHTSMPYIGSPETQDTPCEERDLKLFKFQVFDLFPLIAHKAPKGTDASLVEGHGRPHRSSAPRVFQAKSKARIRAQCKRQRQAEDAAHALLSPSYFLPRRHRSPTGTRSLPKPARSMMPPYQEDIRGDMPVEFPIPPRNPFRQNPKIDHAS